MTSSRSSKWLVALAVLLVWVGQADAGRKRVVILELEGPQGEKFHQELVSLVKKSHTVIKLAKWTKKAEELDAGKVTEKNVKKVAKKLKVDGVITGKIEKRRDEYVIKLKLRAGTTGELTGSSIQTKADGPRLEGRAQKDIKDELIALIDELESNRGGDGGEDEEDKKGADAITDGPKKSGFGRKGDDDRNGDDGENKGGGDGDGDETEETRARSSDDEDTGRKKKKKKRKSSSDDDGEDNSVEDDADVGEGDHELNVSPSRRAIDAVAGLSFTARRLKFSHAADLSNPPPGYKQTIPVAGALVDVTFYPMAFSRKRKVDYYTGIGLNILYDRVLIINSQKRYADGAGDPQIADLETKESRWAVGPVFRYPLGKKATAPVVGGSLTYGKQAFTVAQQLPNMEPTDIPNVAYSMFTLGASFRLPIMPKITANADAAFHAITNTGAIQTSAQYGAATVSGFEFEIGGDYMFKKNLFARGSFRYQTIGFKFKGDPTSQSNTRDTDPEQDVMGARDVYFGGVATVGYVY